MVRGRLSQGHGSVLGAVNVTSVYIAVAISVHNIVSIDKYEMIGLLFDAF